MSDALTEARRATFEAKYGPKDSFAWRNEDGSYKVASIQTAWEVWQAALDAAHPATPAPVGGALDAERTAFFAWFAEHGSGDLQYKDAQDAFLAGYRAQQAGAGQAVGVPVGYAILPLTPTDAMCIAAREKTGIGANFVDHSYRAMVAAAPQPAPVQTADSVDAARLDWVIENRALIYGPRKSHGGGYTVWLRGQNECDSPAEGYDSYMDHKTARSAIDAAILAAKAGS